MDVLSRPAPTADHRISYGPDPHQFGDLWIPQAKSRAPLPLVVFFHGGWWRSEYDLTYAGHLCASLKGMGIATWSVEYRRVGETGGGWPATFQDASAGLNYVSTLAKSYPLDLHRVITMGHSAGGHLAFWCAGRHHVDPAAGLNLSPSTVALIGTIALAGVVDLRLTIDLSGYFKFAHDKHEVYALMGGPPNLFPDRYKAGSPGDLLPFNTSQILIQGTEDEQIPPELPARWANLACGVGDSVKIEMLPSAGHFDVVDPESTAWKTVASSVQRLLLHAK